MRPPFGLTLGLIREHGEVRTKSLAESNDKISVQMARRALKNLTDKKILKRIATSK